MSERRTMKKRKQQRLVVHDPCPGYAMIVGGPRPYVSNVFQTSVGNPKAEDIVCDECTEPYHKAVPAVVLTRRDYRRLLKSSKARQ